ncbi:MAG TPA: hypothetical protein VFZ42_16690 [Chitinophagaceae bacterium]
MVKYRYAFLSIILLIAQVSLNAQSGRHNIEAGVSGNVPYGMQSNTNIGLGIDAGYLYKLHEQNLLIFSFASNKFRTNLEGNQYDNHFRSISAGVRHLFSERIYAQVLIGGAGYETTLVDNHFLGYGQLRAGYLMPSRNTAFDFSILINQTTEGMGWFGLRVGTMLTFGKSTER